MLIRDLFRLIIKLFCIYLIIQIALFYVPASFSSLVYGFDGISLLWIIVVNLIVVGVGMGLIKHVDKIIDFFKLDKGFDNSMIQVGNFTPKTLLTFSIMLIGGFLIVDYIPSFLYNCFSAFKSAANTGGNLDDLVFRDYDRVDYFDWGITALNLILGYVLVVYASTIATYMVRPKKR